eukprot:PhF_6_TR39086/c0_g1_i2/m.58496
MSSKPKLKPLAVVELPPPLLPPQDDAVAPPPPPPPRRLHALGGSLLDFVGDCIVNAANTGGVTGFGIDELVNRAAGDVEIKDARRGFGGIPTGEAKVTPSFKHTKVKWIVHAVGPVFRENAMENAGASEDDKDMMLFNAYLNSMRRASELECKTVGVCLLSAGVFRGRRPLKDVIGIGVNAILEGLASLPHIEEVSLIAFTPEEQKALTECVKAAGVKFA